MYCWYTYGIRGPNVSNEGPSSEKGTFPWWRPFLRQKKAFFPDESPSLIRKKRFSLMKALPSSEKGVFPQWRPFARNVRLCFPHIGYSATYLFIFWLNFTYLSCCFMQEEQITCFFFCFSCLGLFFFCCCSSLQSYFCFQNHEKTLEVLNKLLSQVSLSCSGWKFRSMIYKCYLFNFLVRFLFCSFNKTQVITGNRNSTIFLFNMVLILSIGGFNSSNFSLEQRQIKDIFICGRRKVRCIYGIT